MDQLRMGRFSLLFGTIGLAAVAATFFVPTLFVLSGLFGFTILLMGLLGVRTGAGRMGLIAALLVLPGATFLAYRFGFEARATKEKPRPPSAKLPAELYFSPHGGCTDAIISEIAGAKRSILVQAYSFTSKPIAAALAEAHRRGVSVHVVLDKSQETNKYSGATFLRNNGIGPRIDHVHAIAHNKVMIIDSSVVITGSMNFSGAGESQNAENVLVLRDISLAAKYTNNWEQHAGHSEPYRSTPVSPAVQKAAPDAEADFTDTNL